MTNDADWENNGDGPKKGTPSSSTPVSHSSRSNQTINRLVPIDHGFTLPTTVADLDFEWLLWPQAKVPFNEDEIKYVQKLDIDKDISMLNQLGFPPASITLVYAATLLLKIAVANGHTLRDIGEYMRRSRLGISSDFETAIAASRSSIATGAAMDWQSLATMFHRRFGPKGAEEVDFQLACQIGSPCKLQPLLEPSHCVPRSAPPLSSPPDAFPPSTPTGVDALLTPSGPLHKSSDGFEGVDFAGSDISSPLVSPLDSLPPIAGCPEL
eukprot:NODE_504_length_2024_cov_13.212658_g399_i0.p1 GENE.NODE_504_length_2024_cov_13.212658_g399_i0~~NODE_504_length_2024_cov_13.212658_g399_i0.p1  ORF type:complete len:276 (-),score=62.59 NODE_504_length_2024_cov_13.212658_g399_i0:1197-2000(-)